MRWMDPPESVPRFSVNQRVQHGIASLLGLLLVASAVGSILTRNPGWIAFHRYAGMAACALFALHLGYLVLIGIRHDVSVEQVAFLPFGREWKILTGRAAGNHPVGKYAPEEKGDYLAILALSVLVVSTGIFLSWPYRLGIPGRVAFGWLRTVHAAISAAWVFHIAANHFSARWLESPREFRRSILLGKVPLSLAEDRSSWIEDLVRMKVLIPVPQEGVREDAVQSRQVRDLLEEGNRQAREGMFAEASAAFEEALRLLPDYSQARFNLAISRMKEGKDDLAEEQFRLFIASDPFNPMAIRAKELMDSIRRRPGEGRPL